MRLKVWIILLISFLLIMVSGRFRQPLADSSNVHNVINNYAESAILSNSSNRPSTDSGNE